MSFILDALRKSENERQQVTPAEFASVPSSPGASHTPAWLWLLGALLVINAVVLVGFMTRGPAPTAAGPSAGDTTPAAPATNETAPVPVVTEPVTAVAGRESAGESPTFAEQVARRRLGREPVVEPARTADDAGRTPAPAGDADATAAVEPAPAEAPAPADAFLPSIDELRMQGALTLPELHVDIHVYSDVPADRFVFINMNKYREADRLGEGPLVREITRDGVVLEHRGTAFVLPRE